MSAQIALAETPLRTDERNFGKAKACFDAFGAVAAQAEALGAGGGYDEAAAYAGAAALAAMQPHAGFFVSPRLERLLTSIGRSVARPTHYRRPQTVKIRRILHVASELAAVGGLTNNLVHWLEADASRTHSLAVTQHRHDLPTNITGPITRSGGKVYRINQTVGHQVAWARKLREISHGYDAIVLHSYGQDPVPLMAFAEPEKRPPILLLNHADHIFWLGASIADVVINMREAAQDLSIARRKIESRRNIVVPTVISPPVRQRSREEARRQLGIAQDAVLIFSVARAMKYRTVDGVTYPSPLVPLLKKHPTAVLLVLGAGDDRDDWKADSAAVGGRIRSLAETPEARVYHEAADIYVDSFPFVSSTSMMEAAGLGVPMVSRFYGPREARIFAINHPGIDKPTLHAANEREFVAHLDRLISDPGFRAQKGREGREAVLHYHTPPTWLTFIERAYALAEQVSPVDTAGHFEADETEVFSHGEPDRSLYEIFGVPDGDGHRSMRGFLGVMPAGARIKAWRQLKRRGGLDSAKDAVRLLLPDWLVRRLSA